MFETFNICCIVFGSVTKIEIMLTNHEFITYLNIRMSKS